MYEICTLLSCFSQKKYGQKVLNILLLRFIGLFLFSWFFDISVRAFLILSGQEGVCNLRSLSCFSPYFIL